MAKKQTFAEKAKKGKKDDGLHAVKVVTPEMDPVTGHWKFRTKMVVITDQNKKEIYG